MNLKHVSKRNAVLTIGLMVLTVISSFAQSPEVKKALRLIDIEQPTKGITALEQLVTATPTSSSNLYYLGLGYIRTGAKDKALEAFEKGIKLNEKDGLNYAGKGHVRLLEKNPADAKVNLDKALAVSRSKEASVLRAVGAAYINDTKFLLDAINALNKAKTINATDPETHILLGDALLLQNQQQGGEAVSSYERAAKADPKSGKPYYKIGEIFQRARNNDEAIKHFTQAVTIDPEYAPAFKELGEIYYLQKQADKAVEAYEKYLSITEKPGDSKFKLAFFYFMAKKYDKANETFKEVTTNPNVPCVATRYYAYSLTEQKNTVEARKIFDKYFQCAKPEDLQGSDYLYFGKLLLETKEDSLASMNFAKALELDSMNIEAAQLNAETYFKRKKFPEAIQAYKQLEKIKDPPSTADLFNLGRSYFYNLQFQDADSAFTKVSEKAPNMTVGYQWAAKARQQIDSTGSLGLANPMYELLIEKALANPDKYKKELVEAYFYFASYYINIKKDAVKAKEYLEKILAIDPAHAQAKEALKILNEPAPKSPNKGGKK